MNVEALAFKKNKVKLFVCKIPTYDGNYDEQFLLLEDKKTQAFFTNF